MDMSVQETITHLHECYNYSSTYQSARHINNSHNPPSSFAYFLEYLICMRSNDARNFSRNVPFFSQKFISIKKVKFPHKSRNTGWHNSQNFPNGNAVFLLFVFFNSWLVTSRRGHVTLHQHQSSGSNFTAFTQTTKNQTI